MRAAGQGTGETTGPVGRNPVFLSAWRKLRQLPPALAISVFAPLVTAAAPQPPLLTTAEIVSSAPARAWRPVAPENLMLVETAKGTLTIELAPGFAPAHVAAIRALGDRKSVV